MKPWAWILLAGSAIVMIVLITRSNTVPQNGAVNPTVTAAAGLGGLLSGLFKGGGGKVSAPSATAGSIPGDTGYSYNGLSAQAYGSAYSQAMAGTGEVASHSAGPGLSGQSSSSDPLGIGTLQAPNFDVGTSGADFSN